jgi:hypothetical protein
MKGSIPILLILLGTASIGLAGVPDACGPWPTKPPWQWTNEERIDRRFDERCLAARRLEAANDKRRDGSCRSSGTITDFVFGTDTPELFLPWELFDTLLRKETLAAPNFADGQRLIFEQRVRAANLAMPDGFWKKTEGSAADYIHALRDQQMMSTKLDAGSSADRRKRIADISASQRANCALRTAALERARAAFDPGAFDRLLYVAVAPGLCSSGSGERDMKSWVSRGCPGGR